MSSRRIRLHGNVYWFLGESLDEDAAIAPLHHCDDMGNPITLRGDSYAHYIPDEGVMRYRRRIASAEDIEFLDIEGKVERQLLENLQ